MIEVHKILQKIQSELKAPKSQFNSFWNYKYRNCEDILESVKPIAAKYESAVVCTDEIVMIGERYYVKAEAKLLTPDGVIYTTAFARETEDKKGMDASQVTGSSSSYARKYALNGLFAIDDTKDADTPTAPSNAEDKKSDPKKTKKEESDTDLKDKINSLCAKIAEVKGVGAGTVYKDACKRLSISGDMDTDKLKAVLKKLVEIDKEVTA